MEKEKKEVAVKKTEIQQVEPTQSELIRLAIEGKADLTALERVFELKMRNEANEAKKAYHKAMAVVHGKIDTVRKTCKNNQTSSMYADLCDVIKSAKVAYSECGFSVSTYEGETQKENHVRVCMDVTHEAGHRETFHYDVPLDGKGIKGNVNMTPIHAKASSVSYGRRYLLCMVFNIPTGDDNDGNTAPVEYIDDQQKSTILDFIAEKNVDLDRFLTYMKIDKLEELPKSKFNQACIALKNAKGRK